MALKGLKVIEFVGLAPGPFCGMLLADFGATVTRIDKTPNNNLDVLQAGKRSIAVDLKKPEAIELVQSMCHQSDVVIEPFRPGVMEKLGLGPSDVMKTNPRLIYARLTGFGQYGSHASRAGHDINYLAVSGVLSMFGRKSERPTPPINFAADFAGGGLLCAFGILAAVLERHHSGKGQIVDHAMVEGAAYVASWLFRSRELPIWGKPRGENVLDSGAHFYDTFQTKDGKFMSVGAIEPQFYRNLLEGLGLPLDTPQFGDDSKNRLLLETIFLTKTQEEWSEIFQKQDACVFPVLESNEAYRYPHNAERNTFLERNKTEENELVPAPAPKLSRTPARSGVLSRYKDEFEITKEVLAEVGLTSEDVMKLYDKQVLLLKTRPKF